MVRYMLMFVPLILAFQEEHGNKGDLEIAEKGMTPTKEWLSKHIQENFPEEAEVGITLDQGRAVLLYQRKKTHEAVLSFFSGGKEKKLWEYEDGGAVFSGQIPAAKLIGIDMDQDGQKELLFIYSINQGRVHYETILVILSGADLMKVGSIDLDRNDYDDRFQKPKDKYKYGAASEDGKPGTRTRANVFLLPAESKNGIAHIYIWYRHERSAMFDKSGELPSHDFDLIEEEVKIWEWDKHGLSDPTAHKAKEGTKMLFEALGRKNVAIVY